MKKLMSFLLILCLSATGFFVSADEPITVILDDKIVESDAQPFLYQDRTMVGLRGIFEQMGATVLWNEEEQSVLVSNNTREVKLVIDDKKVTIKSNQGTKIYQTDVAPVKKNDRTYVPLRFVAETFDCVVDYCVNRSNGNEAAVIFTPGYKSVNLLDLLEETYQLTPVEHQLLPTLENTRYYELDDKLFLPLGKEHLVDFQKAMLINEFCTYGYDDVTGFFGDGNYACNKYIFTRYNDRLEITVINDPRVEESNEEAHFIVSDGELAIAGSPVVKVEYIPAK